jgi:hypothetical protein
VASPGAGKTFWTAALVRHTVEHGVADVAFVHDGKDPAPQADYVKLGPVFPTVAALAAAPPEGPMPIAVVFHSVDKIETLDGVTTAARDLSVDGLRVCAALDEIYDGMSGRQTFISGTEGPTSEAFRKGRSRGISVIAGTQIPQTLPTDITDLADTIAVGRLKRRSLRYIERTWDLEPEMVAAIRGLQRGEFVLLDDTSEWDRTVYGPAV